MQTSTSSDSYFLPDVHAGSAGRKGMGLKLWGFVAKYARPYGKGLGLALAMMMGSSFVTMLSAHFMGAFVERGLIQKSQEQVLIFGSVVFILEMLHLLLLWQGRKRLAEKATLSIKDMRRDLFLHMQKLPLSFYDRQPQGRIVTRMTHDVEGIEEFYTGALGRFINTIALSLFALGGMLLADFKLGSIMVLAMSPAILCLYFTRNQVRRVNQRMSELSSGLNAKLSEFISGLEVIRSFGLEDWAKSRYDKKVHEQMLAHLDANTLYAITRPLVSLFCALPLMGLVWFGGQEVMAGTMGVGLFVTFMRLYERFYHPFINMAREIHVIQQAFTSAERVAVFLGVDEEEQVLGAQGPRGDQALVPLQRLQGAISFEHLWMNYESSADNSDGAAAKLKWALKDVSFHVRPGEVVGLVGATGSGKTSTISLLARLYAFQKGALLVDDHPIESYHRDFLRGQIGLVAQDPIIFKDSLRENLLLGEQLSDEAVLSACEQTGLLGLMQRSNRKLDSLLLESGANLSAGEKQMIALTRVLLKNPSIMILDEATAHIDPQMEAIIQQALARVMKGKTCFIVAHRLDTLKQCQRLLVFHQGELVEDGHPENLWAQQGHFYKLKQSAQAPSLL